MGTGSGFLRKTLVWSYERGTLQYDIICALILAFIFFVPRGCFVKTAAHQANAESRQLTTSQGIVPK